MKLRFICGKLHVGYSPTHSPTKVFFSERLTLQATDGTAFIDFGFYG